MARAFIGVGSNLDAPVERVHAAIEGLRSLGHICAASSLYRTRPWGNVVDQPDFVNAAVSLETDLSPRALLRSLKDLETRLGREPGERWGPRRVDLDILTYGEMTIEEPDLTIPHKHLYERAFALVPLAEIDPRFAAHRDALPEEELAGVHRL